MALKTAFIALGANLGDPPRMLAETVRQLRHLHVERLESTHQTSSQSDSTADQPCAFAVSALYRSAPFQAEGPDYFNAAVRLCTDLSADDLLVRLQALENAGGRVRSSLNAPRTLDLDLLLHGSDVRRTERLTLPHPRMHERAFVLRPLMDLGAGEMQIAGHGTVAGCEALTRGQHIERMPTPWVW